MTWFMNEGDHSQSLDASVRRLKLLLGLPCAAKNDTEILRLRQSRYGLGDRRTIEQLIQFSGVDTANQKMLSNRCGNIEYVPFIEDPRGPEYLPKYDPVTEDYLDERDPGSVYYYGNPANFAMKKVEKHKNLQHEVILLSPASNVNIRDSSSSLHQVKESINDVRINEIQNNVHNNVQKKAARIFQPYTKDGEHGGLSSGRDRLVDGSLKVFSLPLDGIAGEREVTAAAMASEIFSVGLLVILFTLLCISYCKSIFSDSGGSSRGNGNNPSNGKRLSNSRDTPVHAKSKVSESVKCV